MNKKLPDSAEDIDAFFRLHLENAQEESFLNEMSWDKIAHNLDIIGKIPVSGTETSSLTSQTATTIGSSSVSSSSFVATVLTAKGLIISGVVASMIGVGTYFYQTQNEKGNAPLTQQKKPSVLVTADSLPIQNKINLADSSTNFAANQPIEEPETPDLVDIKRKQSSKEVASPESITDATENIEALPAETKPEEVPNNEAKPITETSEIVDKKTIENTPAPVEPAKDFREKQLEKARHKSRPIFTPDKHP